MNNVIQIEFDHVIGNYKQTMIALYNSDNITEQDVQKTIEAYPIEQNSKVIIISKEQYNNVFGE